MKSDQEQNKGQTIARAILAGEVDAWKNFLADCEPAMHRLALKRSMSEKLSAEVSSDDIVNGFFTSQLLKSPERMFGPVADGLRPLMPRLLGSLHKYCNSLQRRRKRFVQWPESLDLPVDAKSHLETELLAADATETLVTALKEQQIAIREAFSRPSRRIRPLREILLLSERTLFATQIAESYCTEYQSTTEVEKSRQFVVRHYPWNDEEAATLIPTVQNSLASVWLAIENHVFERPFGADASAIADRLGIPRYLWDKWLQRARECVVGHIGDSKSRELFPNWPKTLFKDERSAQKTKNEGDAE